MKGILAAVGIVLVGVVSYKIIKKKKPEWIESTSGENGVGGFLSGAKEAFNEGYASA